MGIEHFISWGGQQFLQNLDQVFPFRQQKLLVRLAELGLGLLANLVFRSFSESVGFLKSTVRMYNLWYCYHSRSVRDLFPEGGCSSQLLKTKSVFPVVDYGAVDVIAPGADPGDNIRKFYLSRSSSRLD